MKQSIKQNMKKDTVVINRQQRSARSQSQTAAVGLNRNGSDFVVPTDEVAKRAYFNYVNEGSLPGHDVQDWLKAEADLNSERNRTRTNGFQNRT
jgi:hypothetical protein